MSLPLDIPQIIKIINPINFNFSGNNKNQIIREISTDTRSIKAGDVFVALKGENFDGHKFVQQSIEKGAIAVIIEHNYLSNFTETIPYFQVSDTLKAYQKIARWWREQLEIPIIGITGSVGKTTTKELIAGVLSTQGKVLKTEANYNNEIGVPKTLLQLDKSHNYGVIEMAMRASGEIAQLTDITRPTIGVITNVGTSHIGRLGSEEAIAKAKCELLAQMPKDSIAILNHDNQRLMDTAPKYWQGETITYGLTGGDLCGTLLDNQTMRVEGLELPLPLNGRHNALNYLAALAVAKALNIDLSIFQTKIKVELPGGRSQCYQLGEDIVILDETYNASTESMIAALQLLKDTPGERRIAVLGTMKELGEQAYQLHLLVGETAKKLGIEQLLVLVDEPVAQAIATGAQGIPTECFEDHQDLVNYLKTLIKSGDRLLFKASHSVGLDRVVNELRQ